MSDAQIQKENSPLAAGRFLCFSLGKERFAIPLLQVREVIANTATTSIPQSPAHFKGIMNLRGQVISIIDLRSKLKVGKTDSTQETTIVILDITDVSVGVVVDSVDSVMAFEMDMISNPPEQDSSAKNNYIIGVAKEKDHLTLIIDLQKILNTDDMIALRQQNQKAG